MNTVAYIDALNNVFILNGAVIVTITGIPAIYYLLEDHYIENTYLFAGTTVTEAVELPINWSPTPNVDPLNISAVQAFYAAGPVLPGPIRTQFYGRNVSAPKTHWTQLSKFNPSISRWALTGLGSDQSLYPPILM